MGYGYRSIEFLVGCVERVERAADRHYEIDEINREGIAATPANSRYNEAVIEAGRESILNNGKLVSLPL